MEQVWSRCTIGTTPFHTCDADASTLVAMAESVILWRLRRIEALQREDANPALILAEVRELVAAAEEVRRAEKAERLVGELAPQN